MRRKRYRICARSNGKKACASSRGEAIRKLERKLGKPVCRAIITVRRGRQAG